MSNSATIQTQPRDGSILGHPKGSIPQHRGLTTACRAQQHQRAGLQQLLHLFGILLVAKAASQSCAEAERRRYNMILYGMVSGKLYIKINVM